MMVLETWPDDLVELHHSSEMRESHLYSLYEPSS